MISIPNIDSKIWNIENKTSDIISAMLQGGSVDIDLNAEGPDAGTLGLYELLDKLCDRYKFPAEKITIHTCNQLEAHDSYKIKIYPPLYILETQKFIQENHAHFLPKKFDDNFKTFGLFIGRSNHIRLKLAAVLFDKYESQTALTFHYNRHDDYHRDHLGFDDLLKFSHTNQQLDQAVKLVKASPVTLQDTEELYPMLSPAHLNISKLYHKFFVEIVCETYFTGTSFYPTEKIWRPLALKTPFIIQGPRNYYNNLRKMGFKTFHHWWDEGWNEDPWDGQSDAILDIISQIAKLSVPELENLHLDMQSVLQHNYDLFMTLNPKIFCEVFNE
jgi:hypothetical protein